MDLTWISQTHKGDRPINKSLPCSEWAKVLLVGMLGMEWRSGGEGRAGFPPKGLEVLKENWPTHLSTC